MAQRQSSDLMRQIMDGVIARAPRAAPGSPSEKPRHRRDDDAVAALTERLRDGSVHSTRDLIDPLPEARQRARALSALRRLERRGAVIRVGFGRWQARGDLVGAN